MTNNVDKEETVTFVNNVGGKDTISLADYEAVMARVQQQNPRATTVCQKSDCDYYEVRFGAHLIAMLPLEIGDYERQHYGAALARAALDLDDARAAAEQDQPITNTAGE